MTRLPLEALPEVQAVEALAGHAARVTLEGGRMVFLSPDFTPRATFQPVSEEGRAVLLEDWQAEDGPAYHVPASLADALARYFDEATPAKRKPLPLKDGCNLDHLPHVVKVDSLPDGVALLTLADGQAVEVPDASPSFISPEEYAPSLLTFTCDRMDFRAFVVPDALRLPLMSALGYAPVRDSDPRPTVEGVTLEGPGRAVLALRLADGTPYPYRLPVPVPFILSGLRSEAMQGKPYTLTFNYDLPRAFAVLCPFDVWPVLAPILASPPEGGQS